MGVIIGFMVGVIIGIILMCLVRINKKDAITVIKMFEDEIEFEKEIAIKDNKSEDYIKGIERILYIFKVYFMEELQ